MTKERKLDTYPVITLTDNDVDLIRYKHCAEMQEKEPDAGWEAMNGDDE